MMSQRPYLVAANWKMNGSRAANAQWLRSFTAARETFGCEVVVCAPAVYLADLAAQAESARIEIGAQDVSERDAGAYTGDIAASMLVDVGCRWVIVGHSERRQLHRESDAMSRRRQRKRWPQGSGRSSASASHSPSVKPGTPSTSCGVSSVRCLTASGKRR